MPLGSTGIIVGHPYLSERGNLRETGRSRAIAFSSSLSSPLTGQDWGEDVPIFFSLEANGLRKIYGAYRGKTK